ncbi:MAG: D-glycero-beta-D-manno-heptose-7-phosphate kinase [Nitrospirota bacterium]
MDINLLSGYVNRFDEAKILIIGDLMVDHYIWGKVKRISPEAPVPVVNVTSESILLGGAANVLNNILSLKGMVEICGVIGDDYFGKRLIEEIKERGLEKTDGIIVEGGRATTKKTRIIAHNQQVVRFDREKKESISSESQKKIYRFVKNMIGSIGCIVISDYAKGVIAPEFIKDILELADRNNITTIVDPKVNHFDLYKGVTIITPNNIEASMASGIDADDDKNFIKMGKTILNRLDCKAVLITRGEEGMSLFEGDDVTHIPTVAQEVYDVTGAGDTVVSVLSLALSVGAAIKEAAVIANYAAGVVVGIVGTAVIRREDLIRKMEEERGNFPLP